MPTSSSQPGQMELEELRNYGRQIVDWIVDYLGHPERYPVFSRSRPGEVAAQLPKAPPQQPETMDTILTDFENIVLPGITHWNHPGFLAYFSSSASGPGILGELLTATLNVNAMMWRSAPAATELEEITVDWLRQMLELPDSFRGVLTDGASTNNLLAIAAAREALNLGIRRNGMAGRADLPPLRIYVSEQTHSSVEKGAITLGIGQEGVRKIPVDDAFRMNPEALASAVDEDIGAGWRPFCVVATVGTTSTTSVDPVDDIAEICLRHDLWLHVDAAYGGMAAIVPEMRHVLDGVEQADSLVVNPHKWAFTPLDCSAFFVRDPTILRRTFKLVPDYLATTDGATNFMDWGVQLGRRFRALKLWMVLRYYGQAGLTNRIREHIRLGKMLASWIDADPDFERLAPVPFSTVCFRANPQTLAEHLHAANSEDAAEIENYLERLNTALLEAVNESGEVFLSATRLNGRYTIRIAINNIHTDESMIRRAWKLVRDTAETLQAT